MKAILILTTAILGFSSPSFAQLDGGMGCPNCSQPARTFSKEVGAIVHKALEEMNAKQYTRVFPVLDQALSRPQLTAYEMSTIHQMLGTSHYELGQTTDAISAFEQAVDAAGLLPEQQSNMQTNIAQLYIASGSYAKGAERLEDWVLNGGQLKPNHKELLMQAWIQAKQYDKALPWAEDWFAVTDSKQRKHYDLMNFLYNNLGMTEQQRIVLRDMNQRWPDDRAVQTALENIGG